MWRIFNIEESNFTWSFEINECVVLWMEVKFQKSSKSEKIYWNWKVGPWISDSKSSACGVLKLLPNQTTYSLFLNPRRTNGQMCENLSNLCWSLAPVLFQDPNIRKGLKFTLSNAPGHFKMMLTNFRLVAFASSLLTVDVPDIRKSKIDIIHCANHKIFLTELWSRAGPEPGTFYVAGFA